MNRSILVMVIVGLVVLGIGGYFVAKSGSASGITNLGKEAGPPTESEVSALIKSVYESCIPVNVWQEKISSLGGNPFDKHPCLKMRIEGTVTIQACEDWIKGKYECEDGTRYVEADHFVSFKKTDGKFGNDQNHYTMYGDVTRFDSTTGKEYKYNYKYGLTFERRETGWVLPSDISNPLIGGLWYDYSGPELEIPR